MFRGTPPPLNVESSEEEFVAGKQMSCEDNTNEQASKGEKEDSARLQKKPPL